MTAWPFVAEGGLSATPSFQASPRRTLPSSPGRRGLAPWQERRIRQLVAENLSGSLSVTELASACGLSKSHFSTAFRASFGCPPHRWIVIRRVERAKHLLLTSQRRLCDIALEAGFADQSHLTRMFTRCAGQSPAAWRRCQRFDPDVGPQRATVEVCISGTAAAIRKDDRIAGER